MNRNTIYAIAGGVAAVLIVAIGGFFYFRGPANPGVPPLPANARMFNNWALIGCDSPNDRVRCVLLRRAVNQQTRRLVMQMTIARAQNGSAIMAVTLPPNVVIPAGITITPTGGTAVRGPIRACRPQACTGAIAVSDTLAMEMAAAETTALEFTAANGRPIRMNVNIQGFAQGFAAWQQAAPAPAVVANPAAGAAAQQASKAAPGAGPTASAPQPAAKAAPAPAPAPQPAPAPAPAPAAAK
jgi:invasion protein IalB